MNKLYKWLEYLTKHNQNTITKYTCAFIIQQLHKYIIRRYN